MYLFLNLISINVLICRSIVNYIFAIKISTLMKKLILLTGVAILTLGACKNKKEVAFSDSWFADNIFTTVPINYPSGNVEYASCISNN